MSDTEYQWDRLAGTGLPATDFPRVRSREEPTVRETVASADPVVAPSHLLPTREELQISARIILHLARQPGSDRGEVSTVSRTQAGMAEALRSSTGAVSNCLQRLVKGGVVEVELAHVLHRWKRLKIYRLTPEGERLARHILESLDASPARSKVHRSL